MYVTISLSSTKNGEINNFLNSFYNTNFKIENNLRWKKSYDNPVELAEIIGAFVDNSDSYLINMWISLDKDVFIQITNENANEIIKYLYERFPY